MRRRDFISLIGGAALCRPLAARAQQAMRRIGILVNFAESDPEAQSLVKAFTQRLEALGWIMGRNIDIATRWGAASPDHGKALAQAVVERRPDIILAAGGQAVIALSHVTSSLPIVFVQVVDPVALGLVSNLAHPGGNITGFTNFELAIGGKWLQTLKEMSPKTKLVAAIFDPENTSWKIYFNAIAGFATSFGVELVEAPVRDSSEIERSMQQLGHAVDGLIVLPNPVIQLNRELMTELAIQHRLPTIYPYRFYVESGGLMSYGVDVAELYRRAASYVDRILRGERASDLPIEQPTKFEFLINMKTARSLGLTVPAALIARADEVIE
jgi:putative tryptophan/tyrosine transport system substrate-binding protein